MLDRAFILHYVEAVLLAQRKSKAQFLRELNAYLKKKMPESPASYITAYRWFQGKHNPRSHTLLAIQQWLEKQTNK